jgi:hypothetical protein
MRDVLWGEGVSARAEHQRADGRESDRACAAAAAKARELAANATPSEKMLIEGDLGALLDRPESRAAEARRGVCRSHEARRRRNSRTISTSPRCTPKR